MATWNGQRGATLPVSDLDGSLPLVREHIRARAVRAHLSAAQESMLPAEISAPKMTNPIYCDGAGAQWRHCRHCTGAIVHRAMINDGSLLL